MIFTQSSYRGNDTILNVHPIGDLHIGHSNCEFSIIEKHLKKLNDSNRGLLMGDLIECATKDSVGKGVFDTTMTPRRQRDTVIQMLEPYAKFIDGAVIGNHEERLVNDTSIDLIEDVCRTLSIPYHHYRGVVKYSWNGVCYLFNIWHGAGGGSTTASALKQCEDMAHKVFSHVYCIGHFHKLCSSDKVFNYPNMRSNTITKIPQYFVCCGSALSLDEGYADMKNLDERNLGFPMIQLSGVEKQKKVTIIMGK